MQQLKSRIINKLERILVSQVPRLATAIEYLETKIRHYKHQELKSKLKFCGSGVRFRQDIKIDFPQNISIGNKVYIGQDVLLDGRGGITIGDHTTLGCNVIILSANHDYQSNELPYEHNVYIHKPVVIGRNIWIGANVLIVPGISIGDGAIVAAGTVVTANVEPLAIVGNQAMRTIKYRNREHYEKLAREQGISQEILTTNSHHQQ